MSCQSRCGRPGTFQKKRSLNWSETFTIWLHQEVSSFGRRVWARRGFRPCVQVHHRYEWLYVYGFDHLPSRRTFWLSMPTVPTDAFSMALHEFANFCQLGKNKRIFLLVDCAGFHRSRAIIRPGGLRLCFLAAYSPELQPAEHFWPLSNAPLVNRCFASLDELEEVQAECCNYLQDHPDLVRSATFFH